jgi:OOP family OmpA-OmpF porin
MKKALLGGAFAILLSAPAYAHMVDNGHGYYDGYYYGDYGYFYGHDADGDRVADWADHCPGTSPLATVNHLGCEVDTDMDGVADYRDDCQYTPPGVAVDGRGCRMDNDLDGVVNSKEKCSEETRYGDLVDSTGCPSPAVAVLHFPSGQWVLSKADRAALDKVATQLKGSLGTRVEIQGHTDWKGGRAMNANLGASRAKQVRSYLAGKGINADQMVITSFGDSRPRFYNDYKEGRAKNRRVEIHVVRDLHSSDGATAREFDSIR